ncbi:MAG TPA: hypothetical protein VGP16_08400 [Asanoa sp.]|nr:hypothetical protein [Asanoa sp.]
MEETPAALLTATQVAQLNALVEGKIEFFEAAGVHLSVWGQADFDQPYVIQYTGDSAPPRTLVDAFDLFGAGKVAFVRGGAVPL